jgi:hypothetical protein|tara:strand:+ start:2306 stop:2770 length:465 start_codon:yes stop_codon:yes gene_type:complete
MQGFYNLSNKIRETLQLDAYVNTVTFGDIFEVDLNKQTIFPLSHVMISSATMQSNVWNFSVSVLCMDIVDESKTFPEGDPASFRGNNNEQDVMNTQMAVANRLLELLLRGDLYVEKYQLDGSPQIEFFVDRFENKLAGVTASFNVLIPNDMTIC